MFLRDFLHSLLFLGTLQLCPHYSGISEVSETLEAKQGRSVGILLLPWLGLHSRLHTTSILCLCASSHLFPAFEETDPKAHFRHTFSQYARSHQTSTVSGLARFALLGIESQLSGATSVRNEYCAPLRSRSRQTIGDLRKKAIRTKAKGYSRDIMYTERR